MGPGQLGMRPGVTWQLRRRARGGRNARTRGLPGISTDLDTRAAAPNWARLAVLGLRRDHTGWTLPAA